MIISKIFKNFYKPGLIHSVRKESHFQAPEELVFKSNQGIAIIGLNRPKQKNALSANLLQNLQKALQKLYLDSDSSLTRVLVIRSLVPGVFCAGADLKEREFMPLEQVAPFVTSLRKLFQNIHNLPIPVISAIDGLALGGGLEMALASDIRVASETSKLGLVESKLAIIPGAGGTQRLPRLINGAVAKEMIYTAKVIGGKEAHSLGLVNHVVAQNSNGDAAFLKSLEIADEILQNGPVAIKMAKRAINKGLEVDLEQGLEVEEQCYGKLLHTEDRVEGLKAFKEKRKPIYRGQ